MIRQEVSNNAQFLRNHNNNNWKKKKKGKKGKKGEKTAKNFQLKFVEVVGWIVDFSGYEEIRCTDVYDIDKHMDRGIRLFDFTSMLSSIIN